jgi:hypothetical protein
MATEATATAAGDEIETKVPARLERLPWSRNAMTFDLGTILGGFFGIGPRSPSR